MSVHCGTALEGGWERATLESADWVCQDLVNMRSDKPGDMLWGVLRGICLWAVTKYGKHADACAGYQSMVGIKA